MARVAVPIIMLRLPAKHTYPNDIHEVFDAAGVWNPIEDFTFTGRVTIDPGDPEGAEKKEQIRNQLREVLDDAKYKRLIRLLDKNNWDVSFFVDCW